MDRCRRIFLLACCPHYLGGVSILLVARAGHIQHRPRRLTIGRRRCFHLRLNSYPLADALATTRPPMVVFDLLHLDRRCCPVRLESRSERIGGISSITALRVRVWFHAYPGGTALPRVKVFERLYRLFFGLTFPRRLDLASMWAFSSSSSAFFRFRLFPSI